MKGSRTLPTVALAVVLLLGAAHVAAIQLWPVYWFGDDLLYVRFAAAHPDATVLDVLTFRDAGLERYRPLNKLLQLACYRAFGLSTVLPRLASTLSWGLSLLVAARLLRRLRVDSTAIACGLGAFLVHQLPILTLYRNARMEHHATLFGLLGLLALERWLERRRAAPLALAACLASLAVAMLWTLAASCFLAVALWWIVARPGARHAGRARAAALGLVALGVAYGTWYVSIGVPLQGGGRYEVAPGLATWTNLATSVAGWLVPLSSVRVILAAAAPGRHWAVLALAGVTTSLAVWILAGGLAAARRRPGAGFRSAVLLGGAAVLCLFPVALLQHVSEAYLYPSALFFCLAAGIAVRARLAAARRPAAVVAVLTLLALAHIQASAEKVALLHANGERFRTFVEQLERKAGAVQGSRIHVIDGSRRTTVSQFLMPMAALYQPGPQRGWVVQWVEVGDPRFRAADAVWRVRDDGTIEPVVRPAS